MNDSDALRLVIGQRAVNEQVNDTYVKYVNKIEVFTNTPEKWETPQADIGSGNVAPGTLVRLSTADMNADKIYYTTDGSTPTLNSTMYNPIGSEWWSSRQDVLDSINHPIEIQNNTTIKAIAIGPGKEDSGIATFIYQVSAENNPPVLNADTNDNTVGNFMEITFTENQSWRNAISEVRVNGIVLASSSYSVAAGKLIIATDIFAAAGNYEVVVVATDYSDAIVNQNIMGATEPNPVYNLSIPNNAAYIAGATVDGINTMTVKTSVTGFRYFTINITPVNPHTGKETMVFTHLRNGVQLGINATRADFDTVSSAQAGFNVKAGDVIKAYIVDELTNDSNINPIVLQ